MNITGWISTRNAHHINGTSKKCTTCTTSSGDRHILTSQRNRKPQAEVTAMQHPHRSPSSLRPSLPIMIPNILLPRQSRCIAKHQRLARYAYHRRPRPSHAGRRQESCQCSLWKGLPLRLRHQVAQACSGVNPLRWLEVHHCLQNLLRRMRHLS